MSTSTSEISPSSDRSATASNAVTTDQSPVENQATVPRDIEEVDVAQADQSDSWETDDEGDFYNEPVSTTGFSDQEDDENAPGMGLSKHLIECYPTCTAEELALVGVVCDICLNDYKAHDNLRTIPCLHRFHVRCIDKWLKKSSKCPMCRSDLRKSKWYSS